MADRGRLGPAKGAVVKIGLLYSLTGPQAEMERSIFDGAVLAVHQINAGGGVRGEELEFAVFDDRSEVRLSVAGIDHLCRDEGVDIIVGGYTSASRVAMIPAVHDHGALLMYPTYFEGEETDRRVFYCGAAPNQYLADYLGWIADNLGRRVYVIGSDYIYPRVLAEAVQRLGGHWDLETVGNRFAPLRETSFAEVVRDIERVRPDVVVSNLVGLESTTAFYTEYHRAGFDSATLPIAATVTTPIDLERMPSGVAEGHYMVGTYFSTIDSDINRSYRRALLEVRGQSRAHAAQVGAYNAVHAVAQAAAMADSTDATGIAGALLGIRFDGNPEGLPFYFRSNHYSAHPSYVGRAVGGEYDVVAEFGPRLPEPWWLSRSPLIAAR